MWLFIYYYIYIIYIIYLDTSLAPNKHQAIT